MKLIQTYIIIYVYIYIHIYIFIYTFILYLILIYKYIWNKIYIYFSYEKTKQFFYNTLITTYTHTHTYIYFKKFILVIKAVSIDQKYRKKTLWKYYCNLK